MFELSFTHIIDYNLGFFVGIGAVFFCKKFIKPSQSKHKYKYEVCPDKYTIECKHGRSPVRGSERLFCMICKDQTVYYKGEVVNYRCG